MTEPFALPLVSMVIQTGVSSLHFPSYSIRLSNFVLTLPV